MTDENDKRDQRRYPRLEAEYAVTYRAIAAGEEETHYTETKTLGLGGLMFDVDEHLPPGTLYHINLFIGDRSIHLKGKVIYTHEDEDDLCHVGIEFIEIKDEDRDFLLSNHMKVKYNIQLGEQQPDEKAEP